MKLRYVLTVLFTLVSSLPVLALGLWVADTAFERERAEVRERHLLLATNITAALERYAKDMSAAFDVMIRTAQARHDFSDIVDLGDRLDFVHFCLIGADGRIEQKHIWADVTIDGISPDAFAMVRGWSETGALFTPVHQGKAGEPVLGLVKRLDDGRIAFAQVSTDYIVQLQKAVAFGKKGHAAIVDQHGNVIGHPNPAWRQDIKNIAKVKPVAAMMRGETGVTTFFSPAMKKDMIVGYTPVPGIGWGVMVPQPIEELQHKADGIKQVALVLSLVALAGAALLSWALSGIVTAPVNNVMRASRAIATGDLDARVPAPSMAAPREFQALSQDFNMMAERIRSDQSAMAAAVEAATAADRAKSAFLANMSHEFRTPLNAIIGFSDVIRSEIAGPIGNERYRDYIEDINNSGQHLLGIVNDILDLSKIEAGKFELGDDYVDIPAMLDGAINLTRERAKQAELAFSSNIDPKLPPVRGSEVKLKQVVLNLLSNAMKFTPPGGGILLQARRVDENTMEIRVADEGVGMRPEDIKLALLPFTQVDNNLSRSHEGTGLGLPLSRRLVELHGGTFELSSVPNEGTTVIIRLPLCRQDEHGETDQIPARLAV